MSFEQPQSRFRRFVNAYPHHHSLICNAVGAGGTLLVLRLLGII